MSGILSSLANLTTTGSGTLVLAGNSGTQMLGGVVIADGTLVVGQQWGPGRRDNYVRRSGAKWGNPGDRRRTDAPPAFAADAQRGRNERQRGLARLDRRAPRIAGQITLAADSLVNIDNAADTLTLNGNVNGGYALTKGGSGTLVLAGSNGFSGALNVLSGTLSVAGVNAAGSLGPLGAGAAPVSLGSNGSPATFLLYGHRCDDHESRLHAGGRRRRGVFGPGQPRPERSDRRQRQPDQDGQRRFDAHAAATSTRARRPSTRERWPSARAARSTPPAICPSAKGACSR